MYLRRLGMKSDSLYVHLLLAFGFLGARRLARALGGGDRPFGDIASQCEQLVVEISHGGRAEHGLQSVRQGDVRDYSLELDAAYSKLEPECGIHN